MIGVDALIFSGFVFYMINLRDYQIESINELRNGFKKHQRQILALPTGAGKTVVFSEMVRLANNLGTVTIVLTDRTELFKQTIKALSRVGVAVEEISPHTKKTYLGATIYLAMIETLKRRQNVIEQLKPKLIIIDEAHKGNFTKIFELFPDARIIGATATPVGKHIPKFYQNIVQNIDVPDLVESGFLVPCKPYQMIDDFSDLQIDKGEFSNQSLDAHFNKPSLYNGVVENWQKLANGLKTICFCVNIEHTINTCNAFKDAGISCEFITSKTHAIERDGILKAFTNNAFTVLVNCGILTTGYDEPSILCVIMNRATKSLPLWLQCAGRGSRLFPNKNEFILLDFGGNHTRLGLWNEPRIWSLKEKKKKEGVAPVKDCPKCAALLPAFVRNCQYCGHEFEIKESEIKDGVMIEVMPKVPDHLKGKKISELNLFELIELQRSKKYKASYIWRVVRAKELLDEYAELMEYSKGWVYRQKQDKDSNFTDYKL